MCMNFSVLLLWILVTLALSCVLTVFVMLKLGCDDASELVFTPDNCLPSASVLINYACTCVWEISVSNIFSCFFIHYVLFYFCLCSVLIQIFKRIIFVVFSPIPTNKISFRHYFAYVCCIHVHQF